MLPSRPPRLRTRRRRASTRASELSTRVRGTQGISLPEGRGAVNSTKKEISTSRRQWLKGCRGWSLGDRSEDSETRSFFPLVGKDTLGRTVFEYKGAASFFGGANKSKSAYYTRPAWISPRACATSASATPWRARASVEDESISKRTELTTVDLESCSESNISSIAPSTKYFAIPCPTKITVSSLTLRVGVQNLRTPLVPTYSQLRVPAAGCPSRGGPPYPA